MIRKYESISHHATELDQMLVHGSPLIFFSLQSPNRMDSSCESAVGKASQKPMTSLNTCSISRLNKPKSFHSFYTAHAFLRLDILDNSLLA